MFLRIFENLTRYDAMRRDDRAKKRRRVYLDKNTHARARARARVLFSINFDWRAKDAMWLLIVARERGRLCEEKSDLK